MIRRLLVVVAAVVTFSLCSLTRVSAAPATPGVYKQNQACAAYSDGWVTDQYNTCSNVVTFAVGQIAVLTMTATGGTNRSLGGYSDSVVLTNAGNGSATIGFSTPVLKDSNGNTVGNATMSLSASCSGVDTSYHAATITVYASTASALVNYLSGVATPWGTCYPFAAGASSTISVAWTTPSASPGATYTASYAASLTEAAITSNGITIPASTANATATATDTFATYPRIDLQLGIASTSGSTTTYQLAVNDGGTVAASGMSGALGNGILYSSATTTTPGIFVWMILPTVNGVPSWIGTPSATTNAANGYAGTGITFYYNSTTSPTSGWTTTPPPSGPGTRPYYLGVYITCTANAACLNGNPGSSAGSVPNPALTVTIPVTSYGTPAGSTATLTSMANALAGAGAGSSLIVGPTIPITTYDMSNCNGGCTAVLTALRNTTPLQSPGGASQSATSTVSLAPTPTWSVLNGPQGNPAATGEAMTAGESVRTTPDANGDFTAVNLVLPSATTVTSTWSGQSTANSVYPSQNLAGWIPTAAVSSNGTCPSTTSVTFRNTVQNTGNQPDTFYFGTLGSFNSSTTYGTIQAINGWTVAWYQPLASATGPDTTKPITRAAPYAVAAGASADYYTVYTGRPTCGTSWGAAISNDIEVAAYAVAGGETNYTHHVVFFNGFIGTYVEGSVTHASASPCTNTTNYPPSVVNGPVCPGDTVNYTVDYKNLAPASVGNGNVTLQGTNVVISVDGTTAPNNWAAYTSGLSVAPVDSSGGTVSFTQTAFTDTIPVLAGGASGTVTFSVVAK